MTLECLRPLLALPWRARGTRQRFWDGAGERSDERGLEGSGQLKSAVTAPGGRVGGPTSEQINRLAKQIIRLTGRIGLPAGPISPSPRSFTYGW